MTDPFLLDVHGLRIAVGGDWPEVAEDVALDFAWFAAEPGDQAPDVRVDLHRGAPDFAAHGDVPAAFVTPRNVVFQTDGRTLVDYFGKALAVLDRAGGTLRIEGEDAHLVHEAAYLFLLSRVGEHLDARGLPRLHALGLAGGQGGVAVLLPSGGGKSTLALRALREDGVRLLSDDSPLLDREGRLHPFPLRIGVNPTDAADLPATHVRRIERMEFHPKLSLDLRPFRDRLADAPVPAAHLVVGRRVNGTGSELRPLPRRAAAGALLREGVVGVGIYQGMEWVLQHGLRDVVGQAGVAATRTACCAALLRRTQRWELDVSRDREANWAALAPLLR